MRKHKQHILYIIVILLSLVSVINTNNTSALSYQSNVGVGFTFNPTLSVSISPSDLVISNLVPGNTLDSNVINVSVASNAAYGYTLSAIVNGNNSNLTHSNGTNVFSSIATNADLADLEDSEGANVWGYSYKDNTVETPAWSNYNGLSNSNSTTLINTNSNVSSNLDFKIAAKAASTQASGIYTDTINFTAVTKVAPMSLLDSFIASGAEQLNGYFKMQDMTHDICQNVDIEESELQLIDVRDNKIYWIAKLKDGNCWMTQNLDLDLSSSVTLTSETSDIDPDTYGTGIYTNETGYNKDNETNVVSWLPDTSTINISWSGNNATAVGWTFNNSKQYSADAGNRYRHTDSYGNETTYTTLDACLANTNNKSGCQHTHLGNYYNYSSAIASNNASSAYGNQQNSICPKNWNLPASGEYGTMLSAEGITTDYNSNGFLKIRTSPLYFIQSGSIGWAGALNNVGDDGYYWSKTAYHSTHSYGLSFNSNNIYPSGKEYYGYTKVQGFSLRCLAK